MRDINLKIKEVLNGDKGAYIKLYNYCSNIISKFLYKNYPNNFEFEDDLSEILFKIFNKLDTYDNKKSKFVTWITTIGKNYMTDKFKKNKPIYVTFTSNTLTSDNMYFNNSQSSDLTTYNVVEPPTYINSPHDILEISDSIKFVASTISVNEFSMLTMNSQGYTYNEIAKEFNSDKIKISNKLNYTRKKIKNEW